MYTNRFYLSKITFTIKNSFLLFALVLLFSNSIQAQDKKAKALLDAVTAKIKSLVINDVEFK